MPKGEKVLAKAKGLHHHQFSKFKRSWNDEFFNWYLIFDRISNLVHPLQKLTSKTLLNTRGGFYWGGVLFKSKEKHLKQGEKISNLENASQNLIHLPLTICKRTLKIIYKRTCKNKTCGASMVQNDKNKRNNPCIS
jgi:hypothetical protein